MMRREVMITMVKMTMMMMNNMSLSSLDLSLNILAQMTGVHLAAGLVRITI